MSEQTRQISAIIFNAPGKVSIGKFELPACQTDQVIAETIYTFVSPGTELRVLSGGDGANEEMPLIPGYSWVGKIIEVGSKVKNFEQGFQVVRNPQIWAFV